MTYEHPRWPQRHKPNITTSDVGAEVTCLCGWSRKCPSAPRATAAYLDHIRTQEPA